MYISNYAESATTGTMDRVVFDDLNLSDFTFGTVDYSQYAYGGDQVALRMLWDNGTESGELRIAFMGEHIEEFEFADGTTVSNIQIADVAGGALTGSDNDDLLVGSIGNGSLIGRDGDDVLIAGTDTGGLQVLYGQSGNDTYQYVSDQGLVYISHHAESATSGTMDRVVFEDLNFSDFTFGTFDYSQASNLGNQVALRMLWDNGTETGELRIAYMGEHIEEFEFADGTVLNSIQMAGSAGGQLTGSAGSDYLLGGAGNDSLIGQAGDDILNAGAHANDWQYLYGQSGNDTYEYSQEHGIVYISNYAESATTGTMDRVVFDDLNLSDFTFGTVDYSQYAYGGDQVALRMLWDNGTESGELRIAFMGEHIEEFEFADGSTYTYDDFLIA